MVRSKSERAKGIFRYLLAHHPICWQFREHLIRINGWNLCLGCTGFYSGFLLATIIILFGFLDSLSWMQLVILAIFFYLPTMLRLGNITLFNPSHRNIRISLRGLLGVGIAIGIFSIINAPSFELQIFQIILGSLFYGILTFKRYRTGPKEWDSLCETCTFTRNIKCPGMEPLFTWRE
jgi:uncharacterized membrane protein